MSDEQIGWFTKRLQGDRGFAGGNGNNRVIQDIGSREIFAGWENTAVNMNQVLDHGAAAASGHGGSSLSDQASSYLSGGSGSGAT